MIFYFLLKHYTHKTVNTSCSYTCTVISSKLFTSTVCTHVLISLLLKVYAGLEYYAEPADLWSCGIVLVALLSGGNRLFLPTPPSLSHPLFLTLYSSLLCYLQSHLNFILLIFLSHLLYLSPLTVPPSLVISLVRVTMGYTYLWMSRILRMD